MPRKTSTLKERPLQPVHLSLGSNLGDRLSQLRAAVQALAAVPKTSVTAVSRAYETAPWGETTQPAFLNAALTLETALTPEDLLLHAKTIERQLGREETYRWGPRVIDIDIILWGARVLRTDSLTIPHPEFRNRAFVLLPLREIAPYAVDPVTNKTVGELAASLEGTVAVDVFGEIAP